MAQRLEQLHKDVMIGFESRCGTLGPVRRMGPFKPMSRVAASVSCEKPSLLKAVYICSPVTSNGDNHREAEKLLTQAAMNKQTKLSTTNIHVFQQPHNE
jgi:hypothetical protein